MRLIPGLCDCRLHRMEALMYTRLVGGAGLEPALLPRTSFPRCGTTCSAMPDAARVAGWSTNKSADPSKRVHRGLHSLCTRGQPDFLRPAGVASGATQTL